MEQMVALVQQHKKQAPNMTDYRANEFKLDVFREPVVSANRQPLDIKGKCDLLITLNGGECCKSSIGGCRCDARLFAWDRFPG